METDPTIRKKILAYFNGALPPEEEEDLVAWIKEKKEHKDYFFQVKEDLKPENMSHALLKESYTEVEKKLRINKFFNGTKRKIREVRLSVPKIAAMLLLAVCVGGVVFWTSQKIMSVPAKSDNVCFKTHIPRGEKSELLLPDGTKVWVNSESDISYYSNFMEDRTVTLTGEAYFEVAKLNGHIFTVKTPDYNVRVLGTKFNIMAYKNFNSTKTSLIEGHIALLRGQQRIDVKAGESVLFKDKKFMIENENTQCSSKWKDNVFDFEKVPFHELVVRLERWYDVDIEIKSPELNNIIYSGIFKNEETIEDILNIFELTMPITYEREEFRKFSIQNK